MITVPKRWPGETVVLLGGGPSITVEDINLVEQRHQRGLMRVIAINDAYILAPWADVLYAADAQWWDWHRGVPEFVRPKYSIESSAPVTWPDVQVLRNTGWDGLELDPSGLRTGFNSGYQALNLSVHLGAARIVLLGYDLSLAPDGRTHWFGQHPVHRPSPYAQMREAFATLVQPLAAIGVSVVNCSRRSALTVFPFADLESVLTPERVA